MDIKSLRAGFTQHAAYSFYGLVQLPPRGHDDNDSIQCPEATAGTKSRRRGGGTEPASVSVTSTSGRPFSSSLSSLSYTTMSLPLTTPLPRWPCRPPYPKLSSRPVLLLLYNQITTTTRKDPLHQKRKPHTTDTLPTQPPPSLLAQSRNQRSTSSNELPTTTNNSRLTKVRRFKEQPGQRAPRQRKIYPTKQVKNSGGEQTVWMKTIP